MRSYRFKQVDAFTHRPLLGNPVAVVLDAGGIDADEMQRLAAWTNLSETTFVLPPATDEADYRLRIFSPGHELPFAGHPTIGSAHAALEAGVVSGPSFRMECGAGLLPLRVEGEGAERRIFVRVPEPKVARECRDLVGDISASLGCPISPDPAPMAIDVGPVWLVVRLEDVGAITPDVGALIKLSRQLGGVGVTAFSLGGEDGCALRVRSLAPDAGIFEDPVCGSGNATVGAYLALTGMLDEVGDTYVASQGREIGRDGRVQVRVADGGRSIEIGGHAVTVVEGEIRL
jgi:PhzF family phenazine biosynthesis protein